MGGTVTPILTTISLCEATTGWTAQGGTNTLNSDIYVQGNACIHNYSAGAAARGADYDLGVGGTDLQNTNIYAWFSFSKKENIPVKGENGMRIRVTDTSGNWGEWDVFGKDTLPHGGWIAHTLRTSVAQSRNGGTAPALELIRYVGWRCGTAGVPVVGKTYIYFDAWRRGSGLQIDGGTSGDPATWETLYAADSAGANAYGVIDKVFGIYFVQGQIVGGSTSNGVATYFKDTGQVVVFKDALVGAGFYKFQVQGNAGADTEIYLGTKSGSSGISGCMIRRAAAAQTPDYAVDLSATSRTKIGLYGCTFLNAGTITLPPYDASYLREALNTSFEACAEVLPDTCVVENCNFISATNRGARIASTSHKLTKCTFIGCGHGLHFPTANTYAVENLTFVGNTYCVENSSAGLVTIDATACSATPSFNYENTGGGTTDINQTVTLEVNGVKTLSVLLTHGAISGGDGLFHVGYYLRGLTSLAVGRIVEAVDGTHTIVRVTSDTFDPTETVKETTDGTVGGDTGDQATVSAIATEYVQCAMYAKAGGVEAEGTELMNEEANQSYGSEGFYKATQPYEYAGAQPVRVRARYQGWRTFESETTIGSGGLAVTAVWQLDPNYGLP